MNLPLVLLSILLTVICWGNYGVLMHHGQLGMNNSSLRPFIGVGLAYFLIAVIVPWIRLATKGEKGHWNTNGAILSLIAGAVGAGGALGVILALKFGGSPVYVMPLVFGGAPVINTIVTISLTKAWNKVNPLFLAGIVIVVCGAAGVLYNKPRPTSPAPAVTADANAATPAVKPAEKPAVPMTPIYVSIAAAVFCWGSYGPVLHIGQMKMGGSRLRPFLCVGLAYFVIAVATPLLILQFIYQEPGQWTQSGTWWSLAGGSAGALGALGIILAFNFGGKPVFVMPLVFGLAPVMNSITSITEAGTWGKIDLYFTGSLLVTAIGAVIVLIFAPKPGKPGHGPAPQAAPTQETGPQTPATDAAPSVK